EHRESRVQRRRLAGPRGADRQYGAVRLTDRVGELLLCRGRHAEVVQLELALGAAHPQHDLLTVRGREDGHADVHRPPSVTDRDAAVLRGPALGDVETTHDLEPG